MASRLPPPEWWRKKYNAGSFQQAGWFQSPKQQKGSKKRKEWWEDLAPLVGADVSSYAKAYYGTPQQREQYGIEPIRAGTEVPPEIQKYLGTDPYAALGMWQNLPTGKQYYGKEPSSKEMAYRLIFSRAQYLPYLEEYKKSKEAAPAPEMWTTDWYEQESRDIRQMMQEQGFAPEAEALTPERPPSMSWWQRALIGLQAGQSSVIGFIAGLPSDQEKFEKTAEFIRSLPKGKITSPEEAKKARELWETTEDTGSLGKAWEQMKTGFTGAVKGREEDVWTGTRFLKGAGSRGEDWPSKILRGTLGLGIDIIADPLTYAGAILSGTTKAGKAAYGARAAGDMLTQLSDEMVMAGGKAASALQKIKTVAKPVITKPVLRGARRLQKVMPESQLRALGEEIGYRVGSR